MHIFTSAYSNTIRPRCCAFVVVVYADYYNYTKLIIHRILFSSYLSPVALFP